MLLQPSLLIAGGIALLAAFWMSDRNHSEASVMLACLSVGLCCTSLGIGLK